MNKRTFIKSGLGLVGLGLINPLQSVQALAEAPVFVLPKLPYGFADLEPFIDAKTMEIHYSKHHAAYVDKLNDELKKGGFQYNSLEDLLVKYAGQNKTIRNQGGGHFNHSLYWRTMAKPNQSKMSADMEIDVITAFGSMDGFVANFSKAAMERFGSGWAWLCKGADDKLFISSTANQDNPLMKIEGIVNGKPILGLDVWEHAYYLKYFNKRADYVSAFFKLINWAEVERLLKEK
jgi:Fe-Mn family superoxide dismutase